MSLKSGPHDTETGTFSNSIKSQIEMFVNRMKLNLSSRGRSNVNDSIVQALFMNIICIQFRLSACIKETDNKRLWLEQLRLKLTKFRDSRATLDMLLLQHQEKLLRIAEERQQKQQIELIRKKKQKYFVYQRPLPLWKIKKQEQKIQTRRERQKALLQIGKGNFSYTISYDQAGRSSVHQNGNEDNSHASGFEGARQSSSTAIQPITISHVSGQIPTGQISIARGYITTRFSSDGAHLQPNNSSNTSNINSQPMQTQVETVLQPQQQSQLQSSVSNATNQLMQSQTLQYFFSQNDSNTQEQPTQQSLRKRQEPAQPSLLPQNPVATTQPISVINDDEPTKADLITFD